MSAFSDLVDYINENETIFRKDLDSAGFWMKTADSYRRMLTAVEFLSHEG